MASTSDKEWMRASFLGGAQVTIRMPKGTKVGMLDAALGGQSEAEFLRPIGTKLGKKAK